jgi:hypothetical protein
MPPKKAVIPETTATIAALLVQHEALANQINPIASQMAAIETELKTLGKDGLNVTTATGYGAKFTEVFDWSLDQAGLKLLKPDQLLAFAKLTKPKLESCVKSNLIDQKTADKILKKAKSTARLKLEFKAQKV